MDKAFSGFGSRRSHLADILDQKHASQGIEREVGQEFKKKREKVKSSL